MAKKTWKDPKTGERVRYVRRKECGIPKRSRAPSGAWKREHAIGHHGVGRGNGLGLREVMAIWRGYWRYHTQDKGWNDIGYTDGFADAPDVGGVVLEGRHWGKNGAHTQNGGNRIGYACCYVGDGREHVAETAWRAWRAWLFDGIVNGALIEDPHISGHDDWWNKLCPGPNIKNVMHANSRWENVEEGEEELAIKDENQKLLDQMADDMRKDGVGPNSVSFIVHVIRAARRHGKAHRHDFDEGDPDQVGVMIIDRANAGDRVREVSREEGFTNFRGFLQKVTDLVKSNK